MKHFAIIVNGFQWDAGCCILDVAGILDPPLDQALQQGLFKNIVEKTMCRRSLPEMFCKKVILINFAKFTMKTPVPETLF